ncbi:serine/threonine-protein kinase [Chondromyces apiculatus]|uniref:Serine/threonine protein kinase n=1 Tax=Chondromyces apiculatus DSM 436 TaxID=1192034 RepID=A0A017TGR8_9BACT|nr:serine/threonine-protein kinase [Chondromyces apiculatus]EYF08478.1 serine/threonine protein kinase [Chondromyces apiculatus DSM 436]
MREASAPISVLGRYAIYEPIAAGGMARVYLGRQLGAAGFARTVAIKRMLPHLVEEQRLVTMFIDEARLAARIRHPNVVSILDVVSDGSELFLVMEYVAGESLFALQKGLQKHSLKLPVEVASSIATSALYGLHAAHEALSEEGTPLGLVHRDVSPQNILVGIDGITRVLDFGVAKGAGRLQQTTQRGQLKGKIGYVAPEQLQASTEVSRAADIYAVGVVLWEMLAGRRLFMGDNQGAVMLSILDGEVPSLAEVAPWVDPAARNIVDRAIARAPEDRFATALEMANALEKAVPPASPGRVAAWVQEVVPEVLAARAAVVARVERAPLPADIEEGTRAHRTGGAPGALDAATPFSVAPWSDPLVNGGPPTLGGAGAGAVPGWRNRARKRSRSWIALLVGGLLVVALGAFALGIGRGGARDGSSGQAASLEGDGAGRGTPVGSEAGQHGASPATGAMGATATTRGVGSDPRDPDESAGAQAARAGQDTSAPDAGTLDGGATRGSSGGARLKNPCDPPYYVDKDGIQRVKKACFPR